MLPIRDSYRLFLDRISFSSRRNFFRVYELFPGTFVSLSAIVVATALSPYMDVLGVRMGMLSIPMAAGLLIDSPIAGVTLVGGWAGLQPFCEAAVGFSITCLIATRGDESW